MLPYNVAHVLTYFQRLITAYDISCGIYDHEVTQVKGDDYTFIGVMIPPTDKSLQLADEGEIGSGQIVVYVNQNVKLHISDCWPDIEQGWKQTIIRFDGDEYRVKSYSNRALDGLHRKYVCERFIPKRSGMYGQQQQF